jgi:hypothetical protein
VVDCERLGASDSPALCEHLNRDIAPLWSELRIKSYVSIYLFLFISFLSLFRPDLLDRCRSRILDSCIGFAIPFYQLCIQRESSKVKYILNLVVGYFLPAGRSDLRPDHPPPGRSDPGLDHLKPGRSDLEPDHPAADVFLPRFSGKI